MKSIGRSLLLIAGLGAFAAQAEDAVVLPGAAVSDGLVGWWRADKGATYETWANSGSYGSALDATIWRSNEYAGGSPVANAFPRPNESAAAGVEFYSWSYYQTPETMFGIQDEHTPILSYFTVVKFRDTGNPCHTVLGTAAGGDHSLQIFNNKSKLSFYIYAPESGNCICTSDSAPASGTACVLGASRNGAHIEGYYDGRTVDPKSEEWAWSYTAVNTNFRIGGISGNYTLDGTIGEVRVYNRNLLAAERNVIVAHLAARYGVTLAENAVYHGGATHPDDVVGFGAETDGSTSASEGSAGLSVSTTASLASGDYVTVGQNGAAADWKTADPTLKVLSRTWFLSRQNAAEVPVRLSFDLAAAGVSVPEGATIGLYRPDGNAYSRVAAEATVANGIVTFDLPAALSPEGVYTLGAEVATTPGSGAAVNNGLVGWWRADKGVERDASWNVSWANQGSFGSSLDADLERVSTYGDARPNAAAFTRADGSAAAGVDFDSWAHFRTQNATDWGIADKTQPVLSYYLVVRFRDTAAGHVLGTAAGDRQLSLLRGSSSMVFQWYGPEGADFTCSVSGDDMPATGEACVIGSSRTGTQLAAYCNGKTCDSKTMLWASAYESFESQFSFGGAPGNATMNGTIGEVRVYNSRLTAVQRNLLVANMAARYGVTLKDNAVYHGGATHPNDVAGFGAEADVAVSGGEDSAGLFVSAASNVPEGSYVTVGHNGAESGWMKGNGIAHRVMKRTWFLSRANAEDVALRLTFSLATAGTAALKAEVKPQYGVFRLENGVWTRVAGSLRQVGGRFVFEASAANLPEGVYTLGADIEPLGMSITVR